MLLLKAKTRSGRLCSPAAGGVWHGHVRSHSPTLSSSDGTSPTVKGTSTSSVRGMPSGRQSSPAAEAPFSGEGDASARRSACERGARWCASWPAPW